MVLSTDFHGSADLSSIYISIFNEQCCHSSRYWSVILLIKQTYRQDRTCRTWKRDFSWFHSFEIRSWFLCSKLRTVIGCLTSVTLQGYRSVDDQVYLCDAVEWLKPQEGCLKVNPYWKPVEGREGESSDSDSLVLKDTGTGCYSLFQERKKNFFPVVASQNHDKLVNFYKLVYVKILMGITIQVPASLLSSQTSGKLKKWILSTISTEQKRTMTEWLNLVRPSTLTTVRASALLGKSQWNISQQVCETCSIWDTETFYRWCW